MRHSSRFSPGAWATRAFVFVLTLTLLTACGGGDGGSTSQPPPTGSLSYPAGTQAFTVNAAVTPVAPTTTGTLGNFTITPNLPAGLSLDSNNGTISGIPVALATNTSYTITATVSRTSTTVSAAVSIAVNDVAPSALSYGTSAITYSATVASSTFTPTSTGGTAVSWSINPALPAGLNFNTTNGSISGTPMAPAASASYVVTAQNSGGQGTVTLTIEVDPAPLLTLGHQGTIAATRVTASNVLSFDSNADWILWSYATATPVVTGNTACTAAVSCTNTSPAPIDLAGSTAVIATPTGLEIHSTSDGHILGSITTSAAWWKLATDGSYVAAGSKTGLSAWSPAGQLLFTVSGDYSKALAFTSPSSILVGAGPGSSTSIQTIAVPSGTAALAASFNGTFTSWFTDGSAFITTAGTSTLVYSLSGMQQALIQSTGPGVGGVGSLVWICYGGTLTFYPAAGGTNPSSTGSTYDCSNGYSVSGTTLGELTSTGGINVLDLSGATPLEATYTIPSGVSFGTQSFAYSATSVSQWVAGGDLGLLINGASLATTPSYFGLGRVLSVAGGSGYFAVATALGNILYFDATTLAQAGSIAFSAGKLALSSDGTQLVAQGGASLGYAGSYSLEVYTLPSTTPVYTWSYTRNVSAPVPLDIVLSGSGSVLGQVTFNGYSYYQQANATTGGSSIFSNTFGPTGASSFIQPPPIRISPDGTLIAVSEDESPVFWQGGTTASAGANILQNGTILTAVAGIPAGWMDNSRVVVNNYVQQSDLSYKYLGCTLYGANGNGTGAACSLPYEVLQFQPVTADEIYVPSTNQIVSVSTGSVDWVSGNPLRTNLDQSPVIPLAAAAGSQAVFVSGIYLLVQNN